MYSDGFLAGLYLSNMVSKATISLLLLGAGSFVKPALALNLNMLVFLSDGVETRVKAHAVGLPGSEAEKILIAKHITSLYR